MNLLDPKLLDSPTTLILAAVALIDAMRKLIRSVKSINNMLPKSFWRKLAQAFDRSTKYIAKEITPPNPSPNATKAAKVILAALFYVLVLYCTCLLITDGTLVWMSDTAAWRKLSGAGVLFFIALAGRFCFTQGEKLRIELKIGSRPLW